MIKILLFFLFSGILFSKSIVSIGLTPKKRGINQTLDALQASLAKYKQGALIVLEEPSSPLGKAFVQLSQEDAVADLEIPLRFVSSRIDSTLTRNLQKKFKWDSNVCWAYLDNKFQSQVQGSTLPSASLLVESLSKIGIKSPVLVMESFARQHQNHREAQQALLRLYIQAAKRRMGRLVKPDPSRALIKRDILSVEEPLVLIHPLTPDEDARIWGRAALKLNELFREGTWKPRFGAGEEEPFSAWARHSPLMQTAARKALPEVEAALRISPTNWEFWADWNQLSATAGGQSLAKLLVTLVPFPDAGTWPPYPAIQPYVRECRARKDWISIREVLDPLWGSTKASPPHGILEPGRQDHVDGSMRTTWEEILGPLVEAFLRLGDAASANQAVQDAFAWAHAPCLPSLAASLALNCGRQDLAIEWAAIY